MDRYSLEKVDIYMDELLDKMGSDYFPLPIKLNRFKSSTLDIIRETTEYLEVTQEISDDIKPLVVERKIDILKDDGEMICGEPKDYLRLISLVPLVYDNVENKHHKVSKKVSILKLAQKNSYDRDPFRKPTDQYPNIYRMSNLFKIDVGETKLNYQKCLITYIKKPTFANENKLDERIVNLPDITIEKIINKTITSLRYTTNDPDATKLYQLGETFGKRNK